MYLGVTGAALLQIGATLFVARLFHIPLLLCSGSVLLTWIALKLLRDKSQVTASLPAAHPETAPLPMAQGIGRAAWTIVTANCLMSLDNVLAVASLGQSHTAWIIMGLGISIVVILSSSVFIADFMDRYPWLVTLGACLLAWTGGRMIALDPIIHQTVLVEFSVNLKEGALGFFPAGLATAIVLLSAWQR